MPTWDTLNTKIRSLETSIHNKLQLLNKYLRSQNTENFEIESSITSYANIKSDLLHLFKNFKSCIDSMDKIAAMSSNLSYYSILNRQRDVLQELKNEYKTITDRIQIRIDRMALLQPRNQYEMDDESGMQLLLKERNSTQNALRLADEFLDQASTSHRSLLHQRKTLGFSKDKMISIINRVPGVNSLMRSIQNRQNRENLIVGIFISFLICFCIWYAWK